MNSTTNRIVAMLTLAMLTHTSGALGAVVTTTPYIGVTHYDVTVSTPRLAHYHLLKIDTTAQGISFATTPDNGATPGETTGSTTLDYVISTGAKIGINGSFFTTPQGQTAASGLKDLVQLASSNGVGVSPWSGSTDGREAALNISSANVPSIIYPTANNTIANSYATTSGITPYTALGGNYSILKNGVATGETDGGAAANAHTVVGVTGRTLFLFTVDKGQPDSLGLTGPEIGTILLTYGVQNALNLDGGGSTTLVMTEGRSRSVINHPSDGTPRLVGNNFAVFAMTPEPSVLMLTPAVLLRRRRRV